MAPRLFSCFGRGSSSSSSAAAENATADAGAEEQRRAGPVLVELFSSQGCKASPEADQLVSRLGRGDFAAANDGGGGGGGGGGEEGLMSTPMPQVVVLGFHVEYWDYLGWKDPFGSSIWTVRQKAYVESLRLDTLYTPQVVVQGRKECLGTDQDAILAAVRAAPRFPSPTFQATFQKPSANTLQISLTGQLRTRVDSSGAEVLVALCESGLVIDCTKGENRGRVLSNDHVVRKLEKLCSVKDVSGKKTLSGNVSFSLWEGFNTGKCIVVVFVQNSSLQAFGVQQLQLPDTVI